MENAIEFRVSGRFALFTDPITKVGGEKCSYQVPTYEALKGIAKSIYWKPTFVWVIDKVRVMRRIRTEARSIKPLKFNGGNELSIYTYLKDVDYQVKAHFKWNLVRDDMVQDRNEGKHHCIARRMIEKGGRRDIFLGSRECQGYVEACTFGDDKSDYDNTDEIAFGVMFHGFDYPDESGRNELCSRFWKPVMQDGIITFPCPEDCRIKKFVREMVPHPPRSSGWAEPSFGAFLNCDYGDGLTPARSGE